MPAKSSNSPFQPSIIVMLVIGVNSKQFEFGVILSFSVSERSNFISVFIIWKDMIKEMFFFASTTFYNLIHFKAFLMFVLKLLIEKGNTVI